MDKPAPIDVPHRALAQDVLRAVVEAFVLREGTEYGVHDVALDAKVEQVMAQLERGTARIVFDPESETVDIVPVPGGFPARTRAPSAKRDA